VAGSKDGRRRRSAGESGEGVARSPSLLARLRTYLFAGIVVTAPVSITFFIVWQVLDLLDRTASGLIPDRYDPANYLPFGIPGVGLLVMLLLLVFIGWFAAGFVGRSLMRAGERVLDRMPVVRSIYGTLKQIFETVLAQSSRSFREVVLLEWPRRGLWVIGFVTGPTSGEIGSRFDGDFINIFLPTTPNPTSGFLVFVPARDVIHLDMSVEDGIKLVISGGIVAPAQAWDLPPGDATVRPPAPGQGDDPRVRR
jgi:uncharacterized membrane protein